MNGTLFVVICQECEEIGLYAQARKIPMSVNLAGLCNGENIDMFAFSTWKKAQETADFWNKCFKENGRQMSQHTTITKIMSFFKGDDGFFLVFDNGKYYKKKANDLVFMERKFLKDNSPSRKFYSKTGLNVATYEEA